jgi:hypothetical protein
LTILLLTPPSIAATNVDLCPSLGVAWYLDYCPQHAPNLEKDKFNSLEATSKYVLEVEALAGLDDKAREKFITQDKLKVGKVKDALEKSCLKEVEKKKRGRARRPMCRMR